MAKCGLLSSVCKGVTVGLLRVCRARAGGDLTSDRRTDILHFLFAVRPPRYHCGFPRHRGSFRDDSRYRERAEDTARV